MIEFVTLLLGLVTGPRQVEIAVQGPIAAIEISLDGRVVRRLEEQPWKTEIDFGDRLLPHRVRASAFDKQGNLLDWTYQVVNYSRSNFEAAIVLDAAIDDPARGGRVVWQGALNEPPRRIDLRFDNRSLAVDPDGRFVLPEHDPEAMHVLEAAVTFADGSTGLADLTFGGQYVDRTTTALTAVPLTSSPGEPWTLSQVRGWLQRDGAALEVFTVAAPIGLVVVLRDHGLERSTRSVLPWREQMSRSPYSTSAGSNYQVTAMCARPLEGSPGTFRLSQPTDVGARYGLRRFLLHEGPLVRNKSVDGRKLVKKEQKLWDGLAVAGLSAARRNSPRAVVLMIGEKLDDHSQLTAQQVLDYLQSIHVPLLIWAPDEPDLATFGLSRHDRVYVGRLGLEGLEKAVARELESQTIVWVKGEHLPNELSLGALSPPGVALVR